MSQDILQLATALSHERGFEVEEVLAALESALARVVSHEHGKSWSVRAAIDPKDGGLRFWRVWTVVDGEVENPEAEILPEDERAQNAGVKVGETIEEELPMINELNPENSYLGYEINFRSNATKSEIEAVFEFVAEDSDIHIIPPRSSLNDYSNLIDKLSDENLPDTTSGWLFTMYALATSRI